MRQREGSPPPAQCCRRRDRAVGLRRARGGRRQARGNRGCRPANLYAFRARPVLLPLAQAPARRRALAWPWPTGVLLFSGSLVGPCWACSRLAPFGGTVLIASWRCCGAD